ncbi:MAG: InlB B-repeat-containing protein, partial [Treponema sp.]|nr:InlB B-repeat-containing protein [Treponema sp.]
MKGTFPSLSSNRTWFFAVAVCAAFFIGCADPTGLPTFTVTFDLNGGGGTVPMRQTVNAGSHITLPGGAGLSNSGFSFGGWNENQAGTGTAHSASSVFTPTGDVTLFARWVPAVPVTVSFNVNGGTGTVSALGTTLGQPVMLPAGPSRPGFVFDGWNENQAGTGINHVAGAAFTPQGDVTLFARWVPAFTVSFNSNGGTGQVPAQSVAQGSSMIIPTATGLSNQGYSFTGWNTMTDGIGERFTAGTVFTPTGNITLYATWVPALTFIVTFDVNGAAGGTVPAQTGNLGSGIMLPSGESLSNPGFTFSGWNTNAAGTGENFIAGALFSSPGDITLFARWAETFTVTFNANGGEGTVPAQQVGQGSGMILP